MKFAKNIADNIFII